MAERDLREGASTSDRYGADGEDQLMSDEADGVDEQAVEQAFLDFARDSLALHGALASNHRGAHREGLKTHLRALRFCSRRRF